MDFFDNWQARGFGVAAIKDWNQTKRDIEYIGERTITPFLIAGFAVMAVYETIRLNNEIRKPYEK